MCTKYNERVIKVVEKICLTVPDFEGVKIEDLDSADILLERLKSTSIAVSGIAMTQ